MLMSAENVQPQGGAAYLWVMVVSAALLLLPAMAMQWSDEVNWSAGDFVLMALLLTSFGCALVWLRRRVSAPYRLFSSVAVVMLACYVWLELAVGLLFGVGS